MKTADLANLIGTDTIVRAIYDGSTYFGKVIATEASRLTGDYDTRYDGIEVLLTTEEGVAYHRLLKYTPAQRLADYFPGHAYPEMSYDERSSAASRNRATNDFNSRPVIDDFGNLVSTPTGQTQTFAPVQVKSTLDEERAAAAAAEAEAEARKARYAAEREADDKARRFALAYLTDLVGDDLAGVINHEASNAAALTEAVEAIEAATVTEVSARVFTVEVKDVFAYRFRSDEEGPKMESRTFLVLDSDEVGETLGNSGRFVNLDRGLEARPFRRGVTDLALAALMVAGH